MGLCVSIAISILQQTPASYPVRWPPDDRYVSDEYVYSAQCPTWRTKRISRPASIKGCGWKCHQKPPKWVDKRMQTPAGSVYIFLMFQIRFPRRRNEMSRLQAYYWCVCLSLSLSGPVVGCLCVSSIDVGSSFPFARLSYKESKLTGRERRKQKRKK